jgi:hypothetical protein
LSLILSRDQKNKKKTQITFEFIKSENAKKTTTKEILQNHKTEIQANSIEKGIDGENVTDQKVCR